MMRRRRSAGRPDRGFTLIELVVVMAIIVLLAGAVMVNVTNRRRDAMRTRAVTDLHAIQMGLDFYEADNGYPPTTEQGLDALIHKPTSPPVPHNWNGPYLRNQRAVPVDPWGTEYVYVYPGQTNPDGYDLLSYGSDGQPGGNDEFTADITIFDEE
jgi:general secretion pathway protein G